MHSIFYLISTFSLYSRLVNGCPGGHGEIQARSIVGPEKYARYDNSTAPPTTKIAIDNVRVFDGHCILDPQTVIIDGGVIGLDASGATHIDGEGGVLIPGLIESHGHPGTIESMEQYSENGVTTVMNLACLPESSCEVLKNLVGLASFYTAGLFATSPGSLHSTFPGFTPNETVSTPAQGAQFVHDRIAGGVSDFIKIISELPGMDQATMNAITSTARSNGRMTSCHAGEYLPYAHAQIAGCDMIHHLPLDTPLNNTRSLRASNHIAIPTLSVLLAITSTNNTFKQPGDNYASAVQSVKALHAAGLTILAGTDASTNPQFPIPFGESLHSELELLVAAGLSNLEALRSATILPAQAWNLSDRGSIEVGKRADLVLINGDPLTNISATRNIQKIWFQGIEYQST